MAIKNLRISRGNPNVSGNFVNRGYKYHFSAKCYLDESHLGIGKGYIYKLSVMNDSLGKEIFYYDMGIRLGDPYKGMIAELVDILNNYAKNDFKRTFAKKSEDF